MAQPFAQSAEFPALGRVVDTRQEALALLLFCEMEKKIEDAGSVAVRGSRRSKAAPTLQFSSLVRELLRPLRCSEIGAAVAHKRL